MSSHLTEATTKLVDILNALSTDERTRVVQAALTLVGDIAPARSFANDERRSTGSNPIDGEDELEGLPTSAKAWIRKQGLDLETLQHYFDLNQGKATPIALPGKAEEKKEQTLNTYLLTGLAAYLSTGEASFSDSEARKLCKHFGCYVDKSHSKYIKDLGHKVTGSKSSGWKLTVPGLAAVAELIKNT